MFKKNRMLLAFILCSLSGHAQTELNSSHFQTLAARALGPSTMSGRITSIEGAMVNDQLNLYVGTAGGGIWKSQNGGLSFTPIFDKYCQSIGALAIDKGNAKILYAGTGESNMRNTVSIGDGLYKSTDGGGNWQKIGLDSTEHISKILIDPRDAKTVYVAVPGPLWSSSAHRGLYKTTDAGKTWKKILFVNSETGCADITIDPVNPTIMLASFWQFRRKPFSFASGGPGSALYKSTDAGETWTKVTEGLPSGDLGRIVLTVNPSQPNKVLAIVEAAIPGLYLSNDKGSSWQKLAATENITARPFYFSTLVFDPGDSNKVYRPAFDFSYSKDGGYSWSNTVIGGVVPHADHHALWINPNNTDMMYLGTDGGVYLSLNKGVSWQFLNSLPVGQFYHVSADNEPVYNVYGGLQDNGSWMAANSSAGGVSSADWLFLNGGDGFWVQPSPLNAKIVFAESQGGNANRIDLAKGSSASIKPQKTGNEEEHRFNWSTPIVTGPSARKLANGKPMYNLYMANQYLYKSNDDGRNWSRISPDLTTNDKQKQNTEQSGGITGDNTSAENHCTIYTITQHPTNENIIWAGTDDGNLQVTNDGGKTWKNKAPAVWNSGIPKHAWVTSIEISKLDPKRMYASFDNHMYGDHAAYFAMSTDAGNSWKRLTSPEFTGFAHVIREDIKNQNLLFAGTEMGLFISLDAGKNWMRSKYQNMPWYNLVRDIQVHPATGDLLVASHGRGIYVIDDLQPLRQLVKADANAEVLFFPSAAFKYDFAPQAPTTGDNINGWTEASKTIAPAFNYYLKQKSNDVVKLEIYDASNKKIRDINGSNNKGLNKVYWPLTSNPPKVALGGFVTGSSVLYSGILGPKVPTGKYKVILKANGKSYEQFIDILPNEAKGFSANNTAKLAQQSMRLHAVHEKLAALVDSMDNTLARLKKMPSRTAAQQKTYDGLDSMRYEILELKRQTVFFDEFKYRRRLSDLYFELAFALEPLSASKEGSIALMEKEFEEIKKTVYAIMKN
ncbi:MAG: glycosyl hydrolase [Chitinophagaceae bacterium]|nr:MAG: glycosyl hydrolase [Chitinophagaceae bacterium]